MARRSQVAQAGQTVVDVVFAISGTTLPVEYAYGLWRAVVHWLPWLGSESVEGIHRLRAAPTGYGVVLLANRAKLTLRVSEDRLSDTLALTGRTLDVDGSRLEVGAGAARPLQPWATLHSQQVAAGPGDEAAFQEQIADWLRARQVSCQFITGRRRSVRAGMREVVGWSVVLHGLTPPASIRVQAEGMGSDRVLGCGIFVPHKSIAAVA
jgi:CRISPR-associated protein Cas6